MRVEDVAGAQRRISLPIPSGSTLDELVGVFKESGLTRLPGRRERSNRPLVWAHLKDLRLTHGFNGRSAELISNAMPSLVVCAAINDHWRAA